MTATRAPRSDLPPRSWCRPAHKPDTSTITVVPVIKGVNAYEATTAYVDLHWTPVIGPTAAAIVRWITHFAILRGIERSFLLTVVRGIERRNGVEYRIATSLVADQAVLVRRQANDA